MGNSPNNAAEEIDKICGVYAIRNKTNGSIYIGESLDIYRRWKEHQEDLKNKTHHNYKLQADYNASGPDNFAYFILQKEDDVQDKKPYLIKAKLVIIEKFYIKMYSKITKVYNIENTLRRYLELDKTTASEEEYKMRLRSKYKIIDILKAYHVYFDGEKVTFRKYLTVFEYLKMHKIIPKAYDSNLGKNSIDEFIDNISDEETNTVIKRVHLNFMVLGEQYNSHINLIIDEPRFMKWFDKYKQELYDYIGLKREEKIFNKNMEPTEESKGESKDELKEEIKKELKEELKKELKEEIKEEIKKESKEKPKEKTKENPEDTTINDVYIALSKIPNFIMEKLGNITTHYCEMATYYDFLVKHNIITREYGLNFPTEFAIKQGYVYEICGTGLRMTYKGVYEIYDLILNDPESSNIFISKSDKEDALNKLRALKEKYIFPSESASPQEWGRWRVREPIEPCVGLTANTPTYGELENNEKEIKTIVND